MPSATLDTNIYVSALVYGGTPLRLLHLAIDGDLEVATSRLQLNVNHRRACVNFDLCCVNSHPGALINEEVMSKIFPLKITENT